MARVTPEQATNKWRDRLSGAATQIQDGINGVTVAPGTLAARNKAGWLARVTAAADKWANNVGRVSLQEWQAAAIAGIPRVAQGAQAKQGKYQAFAQQFFPFLDANVAKVKAMPNASLEDSINRMVQMVRLNAGFKRTGA